jgi:hypothetical protein
MRKSNTPIVIEESNDGFDILIGEEDENNGQVRFHFNQEDTKEELVAAFRALGFDNVSYEEVF